MIPSIRSISDKAKLITALCVLLSGGFLATTLVSYYMSREAIHASIVETELPLTSDNVYSEIQKDLVRPILLSSMMARDTFLRDWVLDGENDAQRMARYLNEIKDRYGAVTSFFASDITRTYYPTSGNLETIGQNDPAFAWYFRVREMSEPYELNVGPDQANRDALTIFINYRVFDYQQRFIGATGVGLTVDEVNRLIDDYQQRYGRTVFLADASGRIALSGKYWIDSAGATHPAHSNIHEIAGLREQAQAIFKAGGGAFEYEDQGQLYFVNVRYLPELKWYLFVVKSDDRALDGIQRTLSLNLLFCLAITAIVLLVVHLTINRYQQRLEKLATTDHLTGLANRYALDILLDQQTREVARNGRPIAAIMLDIDHFKAINDERGHLAGDAILHGMAKTLADSLRASDIASRWGGEEFLIILNDTDLAAATAVAGTLRDRIETRRYVFNGQAIGVTVSIGVAAFRPGESRENFVARADAQLYRAKNEGRNRVCSESDERDSPVL